MKLLNNLSKRTKEILLIVFGSLLCTMVLVCALFALNFTFTSEEINVPYFRNYVFLMFLAMSIVRIPMIFAKKTTKITFIRNIVVACIYFVFAIVALFLNVSLIEYCVIGGVFCLIIMANRIIKIIEDKKNVRNIVTNIILAALAFILMLVFYIGPVTEVPVSVYITLLLFVIITISMGDILYFCFSRMKFKAMYKIIKKTFAIEILYGLFVLIIACSFIFYIMEDSIPTFSDALWYSFAIVTTIGFGDFVALSTVGRLLSVILGLYGLIVVAVLTSIIVNFYNETSKKELEEKEQQEKKDKEVVEEESENPEEK